MHSAFWRGNPLIKYFTPIAIIPFVVQDGITNKREYLGEVEHPHSQFCRRLSVSYTPSPVDIPHKCPLAHEVFMVPKQVFCFGKELTIKEISKSRIIHMYTPSLINIPKKAPLLEEFFKEPIQLLL